MLTSHPYALRNGITWRAWAQGLSFALMLGLVGACRHTEPDCQLPNYSSLHDDPETLKPWLEAMSGLEGSSVAFEKETGEETAKTPEESRLADDLRAGLSASVQHYRARNYQKASETLSQLANRKRLNSNLRTALNLAAKHLSDLMQMEKELLSEKKQRQELERKLRALSDIEREVSERDRKNLQH